MSWATCFETAVAPMAHVVKGYLEHRGVPCLLLHDGAQIYPVPAFGLRILVPEEWLPVARKLIEVDRTAPRRPRSSRLRRIVG